MGSFRLPTHSRNAHRIFFFDDPFLSYNQNFGIHATLGSNGLIKVNIYNLTIICVIFTRLATYYIHRKVIQMYGYEWLSNHVCYTWALIRQLFSLLDAI